MGVDPGKQGAIVLVDGRGLPIHGFVMPLVAKAIDPGTLFRFLKDATDGHDVEVLLEKAQAMPKQGVSSMFTYGVGFGYLEMAISALGLRYSLVTPQNWQREMFKGTDSKLEPKARAAMAARRLITKEKFLLPGQCKKPHEGLTDAFLIAEFCRRTFGSSYPCRP